MKRIASVLLFVWILPVSAGDPPGFAHWPAPVLKGYGNKLAPKMNEQKIASEQLGKYGNHLVMIAHREASGEAEVHEKVADVFIVESGEATLVVGGKVAGGKITAPGEVRGSSIDGGENKKLGPGDVAHIPQNTPHQVLLEPGKQFTYLIVKVEL